MVCIFVTKHLHVAHLLCYLPTYVRHPMLHSCRPAVSDNPLGLSSRGRQQWAGAKERIGYATVACRDSVPHLLPTSTQPTTSAPLLFHSFYGHRPTTTPWLMLPSRSDFAFTVDDLSVGGKPWRREDGCRG